MFQSSEASSLQGKSDDDLSDKNLSNSNTVISSNHHHHHNTNTNTTKDSSPNNSYLSYSNTLPVITPSNNNTNNNAAPQHAHLNQSTSWNNSATSNKSPQINTNTGGPLNNETKLNDSFNAMSFIMSPSKNNSSCNYTSDNNSDQNISLNTSMNSSNMSSHTNKLSTASKNKSFTAKSNSNGASHMPSSNSNISLALYQYDYNIKAAKFTGSNGSVGANAMNSTLFSSVGANASQFGQRDLMNSSNYSSPPAPQPQPQTQSAIGGPGINAKLANEVKSQHQQQKQTSQPMQVNIQLNNASHMRAITPPPPVLTRTEKSKSIVRFVYKKLRVFDHWFYGFARIFVSMKEFLKISK